jgi:hypothetical protein
VVKIPEIQIPEPTFMITLTRGSVSSRRLRVLVLRFLLWVVPAGAVDCVLTDAAGWGGRQPLWITLLTTHLTLAMTVVALVVAMVTVGVREDDEEDAP